MQVADLNRKRKRKRNNNQKETGGQRRSDNDPLQTFNDGDVNLEGLEGDDGNGEDMPDFTPGGNDEAAAKKQKQGDDGEKKVFMTSKDGTGKSSAGRQAWKEKHRKGQFSGKRRKSEKKYKPPLGI
jgi:hypothetical protein